MTPAELMGLAVEAAKKGIAAGQTPFGCAIAVGGEVVAAHNEVHGTTDITAHAEIRAIREANRITRKILLEGALVATTCEPCPMCMAALHWARVSEVHFGAAISDAAAAGFNELTVPAREILSLGGSGVRLAGGLLRDECAALFDLWREAGASGAY